MLRPVVETLHDDWEDRIPQIGASINSSVCESTGKAPHYILYGVGKRLPYELLTAPPRPSYNIDDYAKNQRNTFAKIHHTIHKKNLQASRAEMILQQHKCAIPVVIKVGDADMVQITERNFKLAPKFVEKHVNKFEVFDPFLQTLNVIQSDRLKKTRVAVPQLAECVQLPKTYSLTNLPPASVPTHNCERNVDFNMLCRWVFSCMAVWLSVNALPDHLKPGALSSPIKRVTLVKDIILVRYLHESVITVPTELETV